MLQDLLSWAALKDLKGSFEGNMDIDVEVDVDMEHRTWVLWAVARGFQSQFKYCLVV